jgi:two-component system, cell cycle sensor histidine kinase and response regulator CckA
MICSYGVSNLSEKMDFNPDFDQKSRMETLGKITAGVVHDFNNILGAISGLAELIVYDLEKDPKNPQESSHSKMASEYAKHILEAGAIGRSTIRDLQTLARPGTGRQELLDLHTLLTGAITLVRSTINGKINILSHLNAESAIIRGYTGPLQNAFFNLFLNARDAMPKGGHLTIRTSLEPKGASLSGENKGHLLISIADSGTGIPKEILKNIFDPFFTTKGENGNGMGLANVLATIQAHGGTVSVNSDVNTGTEFFIRLPLAASKSI